MTFLTKNLVNSAQPGGGFPIIFYGMIAVVCFIGMPFFSTTLEASVAEKNTAHTEHPKNKAQEAVPIAVALLKTSAIEPPPMIKARDVETIAGIRNLGDDPFKFTYLRAVYYANHKAQSTTIYLNTHFDELKKMMGQSYERELVKDPNYDPKQEDPVLVSADDGEVDKIVPPEDQYTISGHPFPGDYYDQDAIRLLKPSHDFEVPPSEVYIISTESAGTQLANTLRYKKRKLLLEFLDADASVIGKAEVSID